VTAGQPQDISVPRVGVAAVIVSAGRVVLVQRCRPPAGGQWAFPGGRLNAGESMRDAVRREVLEETGLRVEPQGVLEAVERIGEGQHWIVVVWNARLVQDIEADATGDPRAVVDGDPPLVAGDDAVAARWASPDEIDTLDAVPRVREIAAGAIAAPAP
jgi:8-oxo-dGTP diphosphatase